jgi:hypothetical protein
MNMELINRRIQRLEPWLASGHVVGTFHSTDPAWTGVVMRIDTARLLLPMRDPAATNASPKEIGFVIPGVPETCQVYSLSPVAFQTVPVMRVTGGTRFVVGTEQASLVLMTEDPRVVQSMRQMIVRDGPKVVRAERDLAALQVGSLAESARRLSQEGFNTSAALQAAAGANAQLQQIDAALAINHLEQSYELAVALNRSVSELTTDFRRGINPPATMVSNPLAATREHLVELATFQRSLAAMQAGDNLLYGADFEDLGQMVQLGWRHYRDLAASIDSAADLSTTEPRHGAYCLELRATAAAGGMNDGPATPVWIEAPPVAVTAGQLLEISGWARVEQAPQGGEGLQIIDSLGGPDLALTISKTYGWERFKIIRAVPEATELRLTFALSGTGLARLDAVMVRPLQQAAARRLPGLAPAANPPAAPFPLNAPAPTSLRGAPSATPSAATRPRFEASPAR